MEEEQLDLALVPLGLLVFGVYHAWLLFTLVHNPKRTVIGLNAQSRRQWVFSMMTVSFSSLSLRLFIFLFAPFKNAPTTFMCHENESKDWHMRENKRKKKSKIFVFVCLLTAVCHSGNGSIGSILGFHLNKRAQFN